MDNERSIDMDMKQLEQAVEQFEPINDQESCDRAIILEYLKQGKGILLRSQLQAHVTASAWITNKQRNKVVLAYHTLYDSWAWTGGHADGQADVLAVAMREACEETGLQRVQAITTDIFSLEVLAVQQHMKHGCFVPAHVHLNITFLLEADDQAPLYARAGENTQVAWFDIDEAVQVSKEPAMQRIYQKLNDKLRRDSEKA